MGQANNLGNASRSVRACDNVFWGFCFEKGQTRINRIWDPDDRRVGAGVDRCGGGELTEKSVSAWISR